MSIKFEYCLTSGSLPLKFSFLKHKKGAVHTLNKTMAPRPRDEELFNADAFAMACGSLERHLTIGLSSYIWEVFREARTGEAESMAGLLVRGRL